MKKELTHRSHELKALGWNQEDLSRYEDLWDYSQRWGLINLEREDRQFLKKAEKLLPKIQNKKISVKKTIEEKSYYLWLNFYLDEINIFSNSNLPKNKYGVWTLLIEEEITNFCQESVKSELSFELNEKLKGDYLFDDVENFYKKLFIDKEQNALKANNYSNQISKKNPSYINVLKIINKYFNN